MIWFLLASSGRFFSHASAEAGSLLNHCELTDLRKLLRSPVADMASP